MHIRESYSVVIFRNKMFELIFQIIREVTKQPVIMAVVKPLHLIKSINAIVNTCFGLAQGEDLFQATVLI